MFLDSQNNKAFSMIADIEGDFKDLINGLPTPSELPILALRNMVLFPGVVSPILIGRESSSQLIKRAEKRSLVIGLVCQRDPEVDEPTKDDLYEYGVYAKIVKQLTLPNGNITAIVQAMGRMRLIDLISDKPYLTGHVEPAPELQPDKRDKEFRTAMQDLRQQVNDYINMSEDIPDEATFAVQNINSENLTESHSANFVNALQGKVAGLNVTTGSGSPNAGSQIIIRGIASINTSQNNEPLFIMDGMPISGGGSAAADINPNDIESVTVLKGAAAAALYGQDAANGVIMITTKQGQVGKIQVKASGSWQWDTPTRVPELQSTYAPGSQGFYREKTSGGWGPMLNPGEQIYDNIGNFLKTGFYHKYDFSVNGGTDKFTAYALSTPSKPDSLITDCSNSY